jgi:hypothetical protein
LFSILKHSIFETDSNKLSEFRQLMNGKSVALPNAANYVGKSIL